MSPDAVPSPEAAGTTERSALEQVARLTEEVRRLSDRASLGELIDRYLLTLDEGVFDEKWAESLFTEDVELTFPVGAHRGISGVTGFTREIMYRWAQTHHHGSHYVIEQGGDRVEIAWSIIASHVHPGSPPPPGSVSYFQLGGRFDGVARRTPQGWRFERLGLRITWTTGPVPGDIPPIAPDTYDVPGLHDRHTTHHTDHRKDNAR